MGIHKLERVMWRLRNIKRKTITELELQRAIMYECGTDRKTIYNNKHALKTLGWLRCRKSRYYITDEDMIGHNEF